jgi:hypothetical protein
MAQNRNAFANIGQWFSEKTMPGNPASNRKLDNNPRTSQL